MNILLVYLNTNLQEDSRITNMTVLKNTMEQCKTFQSSLRITPIVTDARYTNQKWKRYTFHWNLARNVQVKNISYYMLLMVIALAAS